MVDLKRLVETPGSQSAFDLDPLELSAGFGNTLAIYIQDVLRGNTGQWGQWNALYTAAFIPTFLLFGILCSRVAFQRSSEMGNADRNPQFVPLLVVGSHVTLLYTAAGRNNAKRLVQAMLRPPSGKGFGWRLVHLSLGGSHLVLRRLEMQGWRV